MYYNGVAASATKNDGVKDIGGAPANWHGGNGNAVRRHFTAHLCVFSRRRRQRISEDGTASSA